MREISPAIGMSVDQWLAGMPSQLRAGVEEIRRQKYAGKRPRPSMSLIDRSAILTKPVRAMLLDAVASLVDENYAGRGEMCIQFAALLDRGLSYLKFPSRPVMGTAMYYDKSGNEIFRWGHAWVRIGDEVVDGNVDSVPENPVVPKIVSVAPYWGPVAEVPTDRRLREEQGQGMDPDVDVETNWWPDLQRWIDENVLARNKEKG